mgnify:CR=1 FL=1
MKKLIHSKSSIFTSKANVLEFLQSNTSKSKIEKLYYFTVNEWIKNNQKIVNNIMNNFENLIIVRSSAFGEDSIESSQAGTYESILNVNPKSIKEITKGVSSVIKSYMKKLNHNKNNQILIQNQSSDIILSGVLFTKTPDNGSSYYVINFEDGTSTDGVTKGIVNNTVKIVRTITTNKIPTKWKKLILSIKEIENIFNMTLLDIEFGITKLNEIIIFQVRPMTFIKSTKNKITDHKISSLIIKNQKKFSKLNTIKHVSGKYTIFSDMSDWNPSEIIGNNPNLLDYSLYDFLIMKNAWHKGRTFLNYNDVNPYPLMTKFGNKPYVDVRGSFNSLIPSQLSLKLRNKLLSYYLDKLKQFPFLHDKVEFEILFSCYDISIDSRLNELTKSNFSKNEITLIKSSLLSFTNEIIENFPKTSIYCSNSVKKLEQNHIQILDKLSNSKNYKQILESANFLLLNCQKLGTIPFSTMARIAFIGSILLKSLHNEGVIDSKSLDNFMNSISTPLSEIQHDIMKYELGKIPKKVILQKYGHLRPGTYDINAARYDTNNLFFNNINFSTKYNKQKSQKSLPNIGKILSKHGLIFNNINFYSFVKTSLIQREELKFEFTKSLSDAIELIAKAGYELGFSRQDMSNLSLNDIFKYNSLSKSKLINFWKKKIQLQKANKIDNDNLVLPPLLFSENDFEIINYYISKPNFITNKKITGNLITLSSKQKNNLYGKIILIENADPGYDWIFTKNPSALITKYGGVASHMAIRCAEINLPAAIGVGDLIFEKFFNAKKILLDCKNEKIIILEQSNYDEDTEIKKTLKSIGYIK